MTDLLRCIECSIFLQNYPKVKKKMSLMLGLRRSETPLDRKEIIAYSIPKFQNMPDIVTDFIEKAFCLG